MYGIYTPVLLFQAFCVFHAYRNNAEQRWYWVIVLFPLIGCILYLFHNFSDRSALNTFRENVKQRVISNYRIQQLEKMLDFSDTITNRIRLADAYVDVGRYRDAIPLYSSSLEGFMADDVGIRMKLLYSFFMDDNYKATVELGDGLESEKSFRHSHERLAYAWAIYHEGDIAKADRVFRDLDHSFTNYLQRFEYCKFLIQTERADDAKTKLSEVLREFEQMIDSERRQKREIHRDVRALYENLVRPA